MITSHQSESNLTSVLFGKTRRAVLSLFYGHSDEAFYFRQIVRVTGIGLGPVQRELQHLLKAGIVKRRVQGKQIYYQANEKCPIFKELKDIVIKTFGISNVIKQSVETAANKIRIAFIFGSIANSTEGRRSDIDLMVVGRISFGEVVSLLSPAEEKLGREVNPAVYAVGEFKQKVKDEDHFVSAVLEDKKIFIIGNDDELEELVGRRSPKRT